jgi:hypothetical protein
MHHYISTAILAKPITNLNGHSIFNAYRDLSESMERKGYKPQMNVMDNQATKYINRFFTEKECDLQVVEPHNRRVNAAKRAIKTFKDV